MRKSTLVSRSLSLTFGTLVSLSAVARSETLVAQAALPDGCKVINDCQIERELRPGPQRSRNKIFSTDGKSVYYFGVKQKFDLKTFRAFKTKGCAHHTNVYVVDAEDVYFAEAQSCGQSCDSGEYTGYYWSSLGVKEPAKFKILGGGYGISGNRIFYIFGLGMDERASAATFQALWCGGKSGDFVGMDQSRFYFDGKAATLQDVQALVQKSRSEDKAKVK